MPTGERLDTRRMCKGGVLRSGEQELIVDLVALDMYGYASFVFRRLDYSRRRMVV